MQATATASPGNSASNDNPEAITTSEALISREELLARLASTPADRGLYLLEALPEMYYRKGHLPGALLFPHTEVPERAARLLPPPAQAPEIVVYCASVTCQNSHQAARQLRELGYANVRVYAGGKKEWEAAGLPLER